MIFAVVLTLALSMSMPLSNYPHSVLYPLEIMDKTLVDLYRNAVILRNPNASGQELTKLIQNEMKRAGLNRNNFWSFHPHPLLFRVFPGLIQGDPNSLRSIWPNIPIGMINGDAATNPIEKDVIIEMLFEGLAVAQPVGNALELMFALIQILCDVGSGHAGTTHGGDEHRIYEILEYGNGGEKRIVDIDKIKVGEKEFEYYAFNAAKGKQVVAIFVNPNGVDKGTFMIFNNPTFKEFEQSGTNGKFVIGRRGISTTQVEYEELLQKLMIKHKNFRE